MFERETPFNPEQESIERLIKISQKIKKIEAKLQSHIEILNPNINSSMAYIDRLDECEHLNNLLEGLKKERDEILLQMRNRYQFPVNKNPNIGSQMQLQPNQYLSERDKPEQVVDDLSGVGKANVTETNIIDYDPVTKTSYQQQEGENVKVADTKIQGPLKNPFGGDGTGTNVNIYIGDRGERKKDPNQPSTTREPLPKNERNEKIRAISKKILEIVKRFKDGLDNFGGIEEFKKKLPNLRTVGTIGALGLVALVLTASVPRAASIPKEALDPTNPNSQALAYEPDYDSLDQSLNKPSGPILSKQDSRIKYQEPDSTVTGGESVSMGKLTTEEIENLVEGDRMSPEEVENIFGFRIGSKYMEINGKKYLTIGAEDTSKKLTNQEIQKLSSFKPTVIGIDSDGTNELNLIFKDGRWVVSPDTSKLVGNKVLYAFGKVAGEIIIPKN